MEPTPLKRFFLDNGGKTQEEFLKAFPGAFLLGRFRKSPPEVLFLPRDEEKSIVIGSDEDCDYPFEDPTLDSRHAEIVFHAGFRGWTIRDLDTNFGTHVDKDRIDREGTTLLHDGVVIRPGGKLAELQFYRAEALYERMKKAGITSTLQRKKRHARDAKRALAPAPPRADSEDSPTPQAQARP